MMTTTPTSIEHVSVLEEPSLQFASGQSAEDPHDGLAFFGPFGMGSTGHPQAPAHIVIGTDDGIVRWTAWAAAMNHYAEVSEVKKHRLWPPYPGFDVAFGGQWPATPSKVFSVDRDDLLVASRKKDPHERCFAVVEKFLERFQQSKKLDAPVGVAVCVVPEEVWKNCRPESTVSNPSDSGISKGEKASRRQGQKDLFENVNLEQYQLSPDFRRQLKARTMEFEIPIQIVRESTLRLSDENKFGERGLTPVSDRMWNLGTALYYKCGGKPWRLNSARDGVCYIGLAFRRTEDKQNSACCVAQMFLDSGDGIVFLGDEGPWYSPERKQFHLPRHAAKRLLQGVLSTYDAMEGRLPLREIFLHCRSSIDAEEFAGYSEACPRDAKLVGVRVRPERFGPRLYRTERMPVLRGTFWRLNERSGYLFGSGFKPRIATYDGWETPVPLRIDIQHGQADIDLVARDILGLTKLNYNACRLGESQPVTVRFSDAVGEILIANPTVTKHRPNFKFYI